MSSNLICSIPAAGAPQGPAAGVSAAASDEPRAPSPERDAPPPAPDRDTLTAARSADPRTPPSAATAFTPFPLPDDPSLTPAMRQYLRFRSAHPDCVLFFRMGDFYEMFWADAELAHRTLGITLTKRTEGIPMAGVPFHALESYLRRMIRAGHRVAVCEQIQDPRDARGVVERAVTRVLTPGTLVDESLLDENLPNQLGALVASPDGVSVTLALAEVSTGRFMVHGIRTGRIADDFARLGVAELLLPEDLPREIRDAVVAAAGTIRCAITTRPPWSFRVRDAGEILRRHYAVRSLEAFDLDDASIAASGALIRYLHETQAEDPDHAADRLRHLAPPKRRTTDQFVTIDAVSLRSLEIERTMRSGQADGSLLSALRRGVTAMGRRLLRDWLCFPLRDVDEIDRRQRIIGAFVELGRLRREVREVLSGVQDVARIAGRCAVRRAGPRDLNAVARSLRAGADVLGRIGNVPGLEPVVARLESLLPALAPVGAAIEASIVDDPPGHLRDGGVIRDGVDPDLDEARLLGRDGTTWMTTYQRRLVSETGIESLKVGFNKVFGYYIEVTHANSARVPPAFIRRQTLKNAERYVTPELKSYEEKVLSAETRALERERMLFAGLMDAAASRAGDLAGFADACAELDALVGLATIAAERGHVRPEIVTERVIEITAGRHPVLEDRLGDAFVPNDCLLDGARSLALITGPNMAGKSTFIRQVALITLLAHVGAWVPAEAARIGLVDRIFTRIGASDELHEGQSTFMVEMVETASILHHATDRSLIILDEIGRGTSTLDGLALAWAIAETIADRGARTLFATHYHELTALADDRSDVLNLHVTVREWGDEIVFLHRIVGGRTDRSYGIHVARIAGIPRPTVERAARVLETLAVHTAASPAGDTREPDLFSALSGTPPVPTAREARAIETVPASPEHPVVDRLRRLDLNRLTPLDAFDLLRAFVRDVDATRVDTAPAPTRIAR